jgi:hypothetical protein
MRSSGLSLFTTSIFILNIVIGFSIFFNTNILFNISGRISFFSYIAGAFLMLPLILVCGVLTNKFPGRGLYESISLGGKIPATIVTIVFSLCKMGSCVLASVFSLKILVGLLGLSEKAIFPMFFFIITSFSFMIISEITLKGWLQNLIAALKFFPLFIFILFGIKYILFNDVFSLNLFFDGFSIRSIISMIPVVLLSFAGFEGIFSITNKMSNSKKALQVLIYAFLLMSCICFIYQFSVSYVISRSCSCSDIASFSDVINIFKNTTKMPYFILELAFFSIIFSVFGSVYNTFFATTQNIFQLIKLRRQVRYYYIVLSSLLYLVFLCYFFVDNIFVLHQNAVLGMILLYSFMAYVFVFKILDCRNLYSKILAFFILFTISLLVFILLNGLFIFGLNGFFLYLITLLFSFFISIII